MPIYEYECEKCHRRTTLMCPIEERDNPPRCLYCGGKYRRVFSPPRLIIVKGSHYVTDEAHKRGAIREEDIKL